MFHFIIAVLAIYVVYKLFHGPRLTAEQIQALQGLEAEQAFQEILARSKKGGGQ